MRHIKRHKIRILAAATTLGVVTAVAVAAWLTDGTGTGTGRIGALQPLTVTPAPTPASPAAGCVPGGKCPLHVNIDNPASNGPLMITGASAQSGGRTTSASCPGTNLTQAGPVNGLAIPLQAGPNPGIAIPDVLALSISAPSPCQGTAYEADVRVSASTP